MDGVGVTFLVVATGKYVKFAEHLLDSASKNLVNPNAFEFLIFTDSPLDSLSRGPELDGPRITVVNIPSYRWPEATLFRYRVFVEHWAKVRGEFVMYLDADTEVVSELSVQGLQEALGDHDVALIRHPGYYRRPLRQLVMISPIGPWERRRKSVARVPLWKRHDYVCGGVWFGKREAIGSLCRELDRAVNTDLDRGIIARFHDESHLNRWKNDNEPHLLRPEWAFASGYRNLRHLNPIIKVVHKPQDWVRE
jgi:hypothetical protein